MLRYLFDDIMPIAEEIKSLLEPGCERIEIAGSLRRRRGTVKDIEIVAEPILDEQRDLFQHVAGYRSRLSPILLRLIEERFLAPAGKDGERYKRFRVLGEIDPKLDLFIVRPPAQWGVIFAIRTGPAEFSRRLVTPRKHGGLLPAHLRVKDGAVRRRGNLAQIIETPTEEALFRFLEIDWIPPEERA